MTMHRTLLSPSNRGWRYFKALKPAHEKRERHSDDKMSRESQYTWSVQQKKSADSREKGQFDEKVADAYEKVVIIAGLAEANANG